MKDTLAYQLKRPLIVKRDMSHVPCSVVASEINKFFLTAHGKVKPRPETDAINFYMLNHALGEVRLLASDDEGIEDMQRVTDRYFNNAQVSAVRLFYYLILICTRESRHVKNGNDIAAKIKLIDPEAQTFIWSIRGTSSSDAQKRFRDLPPSCSIGNYTQALEDVFFKGNYSGGYGGQAWGEVAKVLNDFVWGRISAETMLDTGFTLAHNNGPIFNKGMLYDGYTNDLLKILDVQRSGQIPNLLWDHDKGNQYLHESIKAEHLDTRRFVEKHLPVKFGGVMDWYLCEALGALQTYHSFKQKQESLYGLPSSMVEMAKMQAAKQAAAAMAKQKADKNKYYVTPSQHVMKITRKELQLA